MCQCCGFGLLGANIFTVCCLRRCFRPSNAVSSSVGQSRVAHWQQSKQTDHHHLQPTHSAVDDQPARRGRAAACTDSAGRRRKSHAPICAAYLLACGSDKTVGFYMLYTGVAWFLCNAAIAVLQRNRVAHVLSKKFVEIFISLLSLFFYESLHFRNFRQLHRVLALRSWWIEVFVLLLGGLWLLLQQRVSNKINWGSCSNVTTHCTEQLKLMDRPIMSRQLAACFTTCSVKSGKNRRLLWSNHCQS